MENDFYKPNIIISKCLNFDYCRYNWDRVNDDFLLKLWKFVNYIPVCPEVAIWLPTPRMPLRLQKDENDKIQIYQPSSETDFTKKMLDFSKTFLLKQSEIQWFIMKNRSPSCGIWDVKIYAKKDTHFTSSRTWSWIFWESCKDIFKNIPIEDEWRIKNFRIREDFLTKIFCLAEFNHIKKQNKISLLSDFQAKNKYLFMSYNQDKLTKLWRLIAWYDKTNFEEIIDLYEILLLELFSTRASSNRTINSLDHIFWYFKNSCSTEEKLFYKETIDLYKEDRIPKSSVINLLKLLAIKEKQDYILNQSIINPFPKELIELSSSGTFLKL